MFSTYVSCDCDRDVGGCDPASPRVSNVGAGSLHWASVDNPGHVSWRIAPVGHADHRHGITFLSCFWTHDGHFARSNCNDTKRELYYMSRTVRISVLSQKCDLNCLELNIDVLICRNATLSIGETIPKITNTNYP